MGIYLFSRCEMPRTTNCPVVEPRIESQNRSTKAAFKPKRKQQKLVDNRNPNPFDFVIKRYVNGSKHCIMEINYPNCTNYEGNKIILFPCQAEKLLNLKAIDPHFCDHKEHVSPLARFEPTDFGWQMAENMLKMLEENIGEQI